MSISKTSEISMLQISDSFFPNGMYPTSSGLEPLFYNKKKIVDADDSNTVELQAIQLILPKFFRLLSSIIFGNMRAG